MRIGSFRNRSKSLWVFSTYSLLFHLAGFLALVALISPHTPGLSSQKITVRLVATGPNTPKAISQPAISKPPAPVPVPVPVPEKQVTPKKPSTPMPQSFAELFHIVPSASQSATPIRTVAVKTEQSPHPLVQVAINALTPDEFTQPISRVEHSFGSTHSNTRILVDHKAGESLTAKTPAKILYNPVPPYPRIARELGLEGKTLLRVEILQDGRLGSVKVRKSCGHPVLDEAATKAIKKWKFAPAQDGLFTVRSVVDLPIRFSLKSLG